MRSVWPFLDVRIILTPRPFPAILATRHLALTGGGKGELSVRGGRIMCLSIRMGMDLWNNDTSTVDNIYMVPHVSS